MLVVLVGASLLGPRPVAHPIVPAPGREAGDSLVAGVVTLDARDERGWVRFDFSRRAVAGDGDPLGWDLAARRFRLVANGGEGLAGRGGVLALARPFDSVRVAPADGYVPSRVTAAGDTVNAALEGWYRYRFLSHLLEPRPVTWVLRTADGRYARFRILSYYCPGPQPGCITLAYAYQGDGSRRLAP